MPFILPTPSRPLPALACLALAVMLVAGCDRRTSLDGSAPAADLPDQEATDFNMSETDQGRVEWKLYAQHASVYNARNVVVARGVRVDFYDEHGERSSTLTSREGELNQVRRDMSVHGDVVVQTREGVRLTTQSLRFVNETQKILSDEFVRIDQKGGNVLTGYGFESDPGLEHYEFKREVRATVRTASGGLLEAQPATPSGPARPKGKVGTPGPSR
jgi:LPS export ABC transporter protein LptC